MILACSYHEGYPSIPAGWNLLSASSFTFNNYALVAYRVASSSGTVNSGWTNTQNQSIAVYRGVRYLGGYGIKGALTSRPLVSSTGLSSYAQRPVANRVAAFLLIYRPDSDAISNAATFQRSYPYIPAVTSRLLSSSLDEYAHVIVDHAGFDVTSGGDLFRTTSYSLKSFYTSTAYVELLDADVTSPFTPTSLALSGATVLLPSQRLADSASFTATAPEALVSLRIATSTSDHGLSGSAIGISLLLGGGGGAITLSGGNAGLSPNRQAASASYSCTVPAITLRFNAPVVSGGFALTAAAANLAPYKPAYSSLAALPPAPPTFAYGGSDSTLPSFLRPYYVKYNSISKSRDLGETEILIADLAGAVGSQAGSNTLFFKVTLARELDLRVVKNDTGSVANQYISVGILDASRKPLPMTPSGYGYLNDIHNTVIDESKARLPAGTYYITVSNSQWQSIDYSLTIFVGSYALLAGTTSGLLIATGRLPLIKPAGVLLGTAPVNLAITNPDTVKTLLPRTTLGGPQEEFLTPGTYTWVAPAGVTSVSAVCVGGGGGGGNAWSNAAGSGGGLGWRNNIPVTPGQSYTVVVGAGGLRSGITAGGNSYFISLTTVAGYGGGNASSGQDTNGPNKNTFGGGWFGDGGGAGGYSSYWIGGGGAGGYSGNGGGDGTGGAGGGGGSGTAYSSTYGTGSGGGTGIYGSGANGLAGRSRDGTLWPFTAVSGFGGSGGSTASGLSGIVTGTGGRQGETASYGQPYVSAITGGFPGGGGGGPGTSFGGGDGGGGAVRIMWGPGRAFPATNATDDVDPIKTFAGGAATPSLTLTIMRGVALGQMLPYGRLKQTWRLSGSATCSDQTTGTLSSEAPYGGGYGY
jgi:hypothetical protein